MSGSGLSDVFIEAGHLSRMPQDLFNMLKDFSESLSKESINRLVAQEPAVCFMVNYELFCQRVQEGFLEKHPTQTMYS